MQLFAHWVTGVELKQAIALMIAEIARWLIADRGIMMAGSRCCRVKRKNVYLGARYSVVVEDNKTNCTRKAGIFTNSAGALIIRWREG